MSATFYKTVEDMKRFGDFLMPFNFPRVPPQDEDEVNHIKVRGLYVDGFNVLLHYSKQDYETYYLETLQILAKYAPFLPFSLVCKIGKRFLGDKHLSLVEIFQDQRKIYCWTLVTDNDGNPTDGPYQTQSEPCNYEGFEYKCVNPKQVNFY
jgi:hypothetical protein